MKKSGVTLLLIALVSLSVASFLSYRLNLRSHTVADKPSLKRQSLGALAETGTRELARQQDKPVYPPENKSQLLARISQEGDAKATHELLALALDPNIDQHTRDMILSSILQLANRSMAGDTNATRELIAISKDARMDPRIREYAGLFDPALKEPPPTPVEIMGRRFLNGDTQAKTDLIGIACNSLAKTDDREVAIIFLSSEGSPESMIAVLQQVLAEDSEVRWRAYHQLPSSLIKKLPHVYPQDTPTKESKAAVEQLIDKIRAGDVKWKKRK
jgi:hypothetical protein